MISFFCFTDAILNGLIVLIVDSNKVYLLCHVILLRVTTFMNEDLRMESESSATWYLLPFVFFQCEIKPLICARVVITVINSAVLLKCKNYGLLCCLSPL